MKEPMGVWQKNAMKHKILFKTIQICNPMDFFLSFSIDNRNSEIKKVSISLETNIRFTHKALVEKSKSGDRNAQYQLYEFYVDAMFNVCMRMVAIKEDAEDVLQDSFVEAFKNLSSFRYESTFGSWLKRIVINKCINHLKAKKIPLTELEDHKHFAIEEEIESVTSFDIQKVKKAIKMLPAGYMQIINLYLIEGYDHSEIAEILNITNSTSKSQYHRGRKKLIKLIKEI
tara:strand:+ start:2730 stop:3416 length:687 start_codon:yes stop_codon:yes gene_type:complete